jgi:hypothetical protein
MGRIGADQRTAEIEHGALREDTVLDELLSAIDGSVS